MDINSLITRLLEKRMSEKYQTDLSTPEVFEFAHWVNKNQIPVDVGSKSDYDMPGYFKSEKAGQSSSEINEIDNQRHFPDTFKTPYHNSFSGESKYADENAPHWDGTLLKSPENEVEAIELPTGLLKSRRRY